MSLHCPNMRYGAAISSRSSAPRSGWMTLAAAAGTIGYEVLYSLGHRYHSDITVNTDAPNPCKISAFLKLFLYCSRGPL